MDSTNNFKAVTKPRSRLPRSQEFVKDAMSMSWDYVILDAPFPHKYFKLKSASDMAPVTESRIPGPYMDVFLPESPAKPSLKGSTARVADPDHCTTFVSPKF